MNKEKRFLLIFRIIFLTIPFLMYINTTPKHYYFWENIDVVQSRFLDSWFTIRYKDYYPSFSDIEIKSWFLYNDKIYLIFEDIPDYWELKWVKYILIPVNWDKYPAYYNSKFENKNIIWTKIIRNKDSKESDLEDAEINNYELTDEDKKVFEELKKSDKVVLWDLEYEIRLEE